MAWSVMQAVGLLTTTRADVEWQLDGADPRMKAILDSDPKRRTLRETVVEDQVYTRLAPNVGAFVTYFGAVAGQPKDNAEATLTVDQALFVSNGEPIRSWLNPAPGWLLGRRKALTDPSAVAEELYLGVLARRPTVDERVEVTSYLTQRTTNLAGSQNFAQERIAALRELAWGLLASTEFRFNH